MIDYSWHFDWRVDLLTIYKHTTRLLTTHNYSAIVDFRTLQITIAHIKSFQFAVTSRFLVTDLNNVDSSTAATKSSLHRLTFN
jgi:hypothetical protein